MHEDDFRKTFEKLKRPADATAISKRFGISADEALEKLRALVDSGRAVSVKQGKFAPIRLLALILCRASALPDAPAFARPVDGGADIYLDMPDEIALDGDTILVRLSEGGERPRGELKHIVKRAHPFLTGTMHTDISRARSNKRARTNKRASARAQKPPRAFAVIHDRRLPARVELEPGGINAQPGDLCLFEVTRWPSQNKSMRARVSELLGSTDDIGALLRGLVALNGIRDAFDITALAAAAALPSKPDIEDYADRLDLRAREIFTIDGADAQDFDDAVSLETINGEPVLGVHIADVSHYVKPDSPLDAEARARGTSVYLPGLTLPMLPEALSNGLCSLKPNEDRLTLSLFMTLDGVNVKRFELKRAVIRSCARLTYEDVNAMLAGEQSAVPNDVRPTLTAMNALAKRLSAHRYERGALDLDLPEPEFVLNARGEPEDMRARPRGDAHRLIEEFMLLANETVARLAFKRDIPFPYRVHEPPDSEKLGALENIIATLGSPRRLGAKPSPALLKSVIDDFKNRPESVIVCRILLRSLSRARYSDKPLGHYGLATRDYCHFTSPIRRYPDLLAHRMLCMLNDGALIDEARDIWAERMPVLTMEASEREFDAANCERSADRMMCAAYLAERIGMRAQVIVTSISKHGMGVIMDNTAEGRVPPQLMDDYYQPDDERVLMVGRHTRRVIRLGDSIKAEVYSASPLTGEVEFAMRAQDARAKRGGKREQE